MINQLPSVDKVCSPSEGPSVGQARLPKGPAVSPRPSSSTFSKISLRNEASAESDNTSCKRKSGRPVPPPKPVRISSNPPPVPPKPGCLLVRTSQGFRNSETPQEQSPSKENCGIERPNNVGTKVQDVVALFDRTSGGKLPISSTLHYSTVGDDLTSSDIREKSKANTFSGKNMPPELMEKIKNSVSFRFAGENAGDEVYSGGDQSLSRGSITSNGSSETSVSVSSTQSEATIYTTGDKAEKKRLRNLYCAAQEILTVEKKYVEELHLMAVEYPSYLLASGVRLSSKDGENHIVNQIKSHLLMIKEPHKMLLEKFSKIMENWDSTQPNMAECLSNNSDMLKFCLPFLKEKKRLVDELSRALDADAELASATATFQACTPSKISIIQRLDIVHQNVVRYAILMESYKKYLLPDSHEFKVCQDAIKKLTMVTNLVNQQISVAEMEKRLLTLYRRLEGRFNVFEANRHLLHEGELMKQCRKKLQPRYLILFSDVLLICKYPRGPTLNFDVFQPDFYSYSVLSIQVNAKERGEFETRFQLLSPKKSSVFVAKDKRECDDWVKRLSSAKEEAQKRVKPLVFNDDSFSETKDMVASTAVLPSEEDEYAPSWIPDPGSTTCMTEGCGTKFNLVNRRHHCRCCGSLICRSCTGYAPIKRGAVYAREKVCPKCFTDILKKWATTFDMNLFLIPPGGTVKRIRHSSENGEEIVSGTIFVRNKKESECTRWGKLKRHDKGVLILYIYLAEFDLNPAEQYVLMGFDVEEVDLEDNGTLFKLCHRNQVKGSSSITFAFRVAHPKDAEKWSDAFSKGLDSLKQ